MLNYSQFSLVSRNESENTRQITWITVIIAPPHAKLTYAKRDIATAVGMCYSRNS